MATFTIPAATIGTVLVVDYQQFELIAVEPYTRRDGTASSLVTWEAVCGCGERYEAVTGLSGQTPVRRCPACLAAVRCCPNCNPKHPGQKLPAKRGKAISVKVVLP